VFGSLSRGQFLERHWQRRFVAFPGAMPGFVPPISPDELAGLACEEEVESRLVQGNVGGRFQMEHGPFEESRFEGLPERDWTLLVQDVDKHVPEVAALLEPFRFLPDWRIDDIMVSFAAPGGSVGPHIDQYDVFLLQARGRRRWQLSERFDPALRADCDLKVLQRFEPEHELIAEPGDILYLPPNVAHFGLALDEAMTFSIGFRAPDQRELVAALLRETGERTPSGAPFADPGRSPTLAPTAIEPADLAALRDLVRRSLVFSDSELDAFLGRYLTQNKPRLTIMPGATSPRQVKKRLARGDLLVRRHGSRWAQIDRGDELWVFAEGQQCRLRPRERSWLEPLLAAEPLGEAGLKPDEATLACLATWLEHGAIEWQNEEDDD
jgi:50S ribosomal protein L16 3-hydroxylase